MPRSTRHRPPTRRPRRRRPAPPPPSSLFDALDTPHEEDESLLEDLVALVALGLLEQRTSPEGTVFALTELGLRTPASRDSE